jgi:hypothetical protein
MKLFHEKRLFLMSLLAVIILLSTSIVKSAEQKRIPFLKQQIVKVHSISATVGQGKVFFEKGEKPGTLKMSLKGISVKTVSGKACFACVERVRIAPNLKIETAFFLDTGTIDRERVGDTFSVEDMTLHGSISGNATEFIVSGPQGATLKKVGKGFLLLEGQAYLMK